MPRAMRYGRDWAENCFVMSLPKEESEIARVTMMPVAVEIRSAGSWVTRPSPMEREMYVFKATSRGSPCSVIPTMRPPTICTTVMRIPTFTFPEMNLEAPSIDP